MVNYKKVKRASKRNLFFSWLNLILFVTFISIILILFLKAIFPALKDLVNTKTGLDSISSLNFNDISKLEQEIIKFYDPSSVTQQTIEKIANELKGILESFNNNLSNNNIDKVELLHDTIKQAINVLNSNGGVLTQTGQTFISNIENTNNAILNINNVILEWFGLNFNIIFDDLKNNNVDFAKYIKTLIESKAGILLMISLSCFIITIPIGIYLFFSSLTYISKNKKLDDDLKQSTGFLVTNALFSLFGILDWLFWTIIFIKWKSKNKKRNQKKYNEAMDLTNIN